MIDRRWTKRMSAARYGPISDPDTIMSLPPWNSPTKVRVHALCGGCRYVSESTSSARRTLTFVPSRQTTHNYISAHHLSAAGRHTQSRTRKELLTYNLQQWTFDTPAKCHPLSITLPTLSSAAEQSPWTYSSRKHSSFDGRVWKVVLS